MVFIASVCGAQAGGAGENAGEDAGDERKIPELASTSPHEAFQAGRYGQAAESFAKRAERRPQDAATQLNLGSALHQLEDYDGARSAFERALTGQDRRLRAKAAYDLGNTAYRQGRLDEAIQRYRETLELDSDDEDAKHNLEFVQLERQRREEQAQQRQDSRSEQGDSEEQNESSEDGQDGEQQSEGEQDSDENQPSQGNQEQDRDTDGDGLSDQQERAAENPTDPTKADSDGDGRSDGEEDENKNGRVDQGESDPNRADNAPDSTSESEPQDDDSGEAPAEAGSQPMTLNPEDVERLLAALEDSRPPSSRRKERAGKKTKLAKDW